MAARGTILMSKPATYSGCQEFQLSRSGDDWFAGPKVLIRQTRKGDATSWCVEQRTITAQGGSAHEYFLRNVTRRDAKAFGSALLQQVDGVDDAGRLRIEPDAVAALVRRFQPVTA